MTATCPVCAFLLRQYQRAQPGERVTLAALIDAHLGSRQCRYSRVAQSRLYPIYGRGKVIA